MNVSNSSSSVRNALTAQIVHLLAPLGRLLVLLLFAAAGIPGQAAAPPVSIRVVLDDNYPPYIFRDSGGQIQGILKDLWDLWQQRTGIEVDFRPMDWGKARAMMESGQADVIDTIFETGERRNIYDFSRPYAAIEVPVFFDKSIGGITDAASLAGFTVGVKDGDACVDYLNAHGVTNLKHYASYEAEVKAAVRHEIRVLCIDKPPAFYFFSREGAADEFRYSPPLYVGEFHWAVAKGKTDLKHVVEQGFARITAGERAAIETRWSGENLASGLWPGVARYGRHVLLAVALVIAILFAWNWSLHRRVAARTAELKTANSFLQESEARFRSLTAMSSDFYWESDVEHRLTARGLADKSLSAVSPFLRSAKIGERRWEIPYLSPDEAGWQAHRTVLDAHRPFRNFEMSRLGADGGERHIVISGDPVFDASGTFKGYRGVGTDITERKQSEHLVRESGKRFRAIFDQAPIAMALLDKEGRPIISNSPLSKMLGYSNDELSNMTFSDFTYPEDVDKDMNQFTDLMEGKISSYRMEKRYVHKNGNLIWANLFVTILRDENGLPGDVIGMAEDITERKEAERRIAYLNRVYAMLNGINTLIVRVRDRDELFREACRIAADAGGFRMVLIAIVDRSAMKIVPVASAGVDDELLAAIAGLLSANAGASSTMIARALKEKTAVVSNISPSDPQALLGKQHAEAGVRSLAVLPLIVSDEAVGVFALYASENEFFHKEELTLLTELAGDIAFAIDHIDKQEKLDYLAYYDVLTGLANRRLFFERVAQYMRSAASSGHRLALFLIDLERFKNINDSLGRPAGDALLRQVAEWLTRSAGGAGLLARLEADHFAAVLPVVTQDGDVARLLEKTMSAFLVHPFRLNDAVFRLSIKVGVALFPDDGADADTLFRNAEAALKKAKAGGEPYLFHTQKMTEMVAGKLTLENQLRQALDNEEFVLHYQPKVSLASGKLTGAEALIRWNDPRTGLVPPGRFIPILEETGLIYDVGRWALRKAIADYLRWRAAGLAAVRIAVNVSPLQLRHRGFVAEIKQEISIDAHAAAGLELEITENLIMEDVKHNIASLKTIRDMGVTIAIDDFGTGFSSLSYLAKLPVDTLKIDRSFVTGMTAAPEGLALVSTVISLAHSLKLSVVAEGVETEEQSRLLRLLNCDDMQGYLYSKPVSSGIFETRFLALRPAG